MRDNNVVYHCGRFAMRNLVLVIVLLFVLCPHAQGETAQAPPLTLQAPIEIALAQQPTLRMGQATVEAAQQRVRQQIAGYLPRGGYIYTYSRQQRAVTSAVGGIQVGTGLRSSTAQLFNFNSTNFTLNQ